MAKIMRLVAAAALLLPMAAAAQRHAIGYSLQRIWGDGSRHCAFTSVIEYRGIYYCAFREGHNHIFNEKGEADGVVRVIRSADGGKWEPFALISDKGYDLRDPKLSVTPDGRLMLLYGRSLYGKGKFVSSTTMAAFAKGGGNFGKPRRIKVAGTKTTSSLWLWRVTWHGDTGYGVIYTKGDGNNILELASTTNGIDYKVVGQLDVADYPNECTVRFTADNRMLIFVRRDQGSRSTILLSAQPPYTDFKPTDLGFHCGGPDAKVLADGRILLGGRTEYVRKRPKTGIFCGKADGDFHEVMILPSAGDNSYPSFMKVGNEIWITYYSTHETNKPSIFLARVPEGNFNMAGH